MANYSRKKYCATIALAAILLSSFSGCDAVKPVIVAKDFIVEITTQAGKLIKQKASTLAEALANTWKTMFPPRDPSNPKIRITSPDGTKGEYDGDIWVRIYFPGSQQSGGSELEAKLKKPVLMLRKHPTAAWEIAPENYPPPFRKELKDRGAIDD